MPHHRLLTVLITFAASAALADPLPGIRFDIMPVGCRIHYTRTYDGETQRRVKEYMGLNGKNHVMQILSEPDGAPIMTMTYDAKGFLRRKDWAGGQWERYTPFQCAETPGQCHFIADDSNRTRSTFDAQVTANGDTISVTGGYSHDSVTNWTFTLGPFNDMAENFGLTEILKTTRYENCLEFGLSS